MQTIPFIHYKTLIANALISKEIFDVEWFASQDARIHNYYNCGETPLGAVEMISIFAEAQLGNKTFKFPTKESMIKVGCKYTYRNQEI